LTHYFQTQPFYQKNAANQVADFWWFSSVGTRTIWVEAEDLAREVFTQISSKKTDAFIITGG